MTGEMQLAESNTSKDGSIVVEYEDARHRYTLNGEWVPGVTSVIGDVWAKPQLVKAAGKVDLQGVSTLHKGGDTPETFYYDPNPAVFDDAYGLADALYSRDLRHWQVWKKSADRGTFVHAVSQAWIEDGCVPTTDDVPEDYREYVRAFGNFVRDHDPASLASEVIVGSAKHGYAGRYDWLAVLNKICDNDSCPCGSVAYSSVRIDFKTSKALFPENMAQLDLYEIAAMEMGEDQADYRAPLRLGKDGTYEFSVSRLPVGGSLGLVAGYKARQNVEELHKHLNPRGGRG